MIGYIQSIQSFSTFDGPGTRSVVFLQGCPVGCIFCHNPDSWRSKAGEAIDLERLMRRLDRFKPFLKSPGLTISGGEPLFQPEFTSALISAAKSEGWHVALDTSGWGPAETFTKIAGSCDLVIFSIKHPLDPGKIIKCNSEEMLANWKLLAQLPVPIWLRYVLIPGWTDEPEALREVGQKARENPNLQRLEILPFNGLAEHKWAKLGWENPLFKANIPTVAEADIKKAEQLVGWD